MRVLIAHGGADRSLGSAVELNRAAVARWQEEHDGYYGTPHGCGRAYRRHGVSIAPGFIPRAEAAAIFLRVVFDECGEAGWPTPTEIVHRISDPETPIGGWMTSAGNISIVLDMYEYREGRRHGCRQAQSCQEARWQYIDTMCPDASPDATDLVATDPSAIATLAAFAEHGAAEALYRRERLRAHRPDGRGI